MRLASFYHVWADGLWHDPLTEHLEVLTRAKLGKPRFGIVGEPANRACVKDAIADIWGKRRHEVVVEADEGYEQVTLAALHAYAQEAEGAVLYAHTKGAYTRTPSPVDRDLWRRAMELRVVDNWRANLALLEEGWDVLGCFLLPSEVHPRPYFAGNFWMATCEYLRRLPPCSTEHRMDAELWLGLATPKAFSLVPGTPGTHTARAING